MDAASSPANDAAPSIKARLLRAASWTVVGTLGGQVLGLLGGIAAAKILGPDGFGRLSAVRGLILSFGIFSGAGLGLAAVRYIAETREGDPEQAAFRMRFLLRLAVGCGAITALVFAVLTPMMAVGWLNQPELRPSLWLGLPLILSNSLSAIQNGILGGLERFRTIARTMAVEACANVVGIVAGAVAAGVQGAVFGASIAGILACVYRHHNLAGEAAWFSWKGPSAFDRRWLTHEAMPFIIGGAVTQPFEWYARITLARQPDGFVQLGLFTAAYTCAQLVLFLPRQFTTPGVSLLAGLLARPDASEISSLVKLKLRASFLMACAAAIPLLLAADWILARFGYSVGGEVLVMLVLAHLLGAYSLVFRSVIYAAGRMWSQCWQLLVWAVTLTTAWICLSSYGAWGLAVGYLVAFAVHIVFQGLEAGRALRRNQN